jgi:hypothetical protein
VREFRYLVKDWKLKFPDREIVNGLGARMGLGGDFSLSAEQYIGLLLSSGHVSVKGITLEKLGKGPIEVPSYDVLCLF